MAKNDLTGKTITAMFLIDAAFAIEIFLLNIFGKSRLAESVGTLALWIILAVWCLMGIKYTIHLAKEHKEMELTKNSAPAMISSIMIIAALSTVVKIDKESMFKIVESLIRPIISDLFTIVTLTISLSVVIFIYQRYCAEPR